MLQVQNQRSDRPMNSHERTSAPGQDHSNPNKSSRNSSLPRHGTALAQVSASF